MSGVAALSTGMGPSWPLIGSCKKCALVIGRIIARGGPLYGRGRPGASRVRPGVVRFIIRGGSVVDRHRPGKNRNN